MLSLPRTQPWRGFAAALPRSFFLLAPLSVLSSCFLGVYLHLTHFVCPHGAAGVWRRPCVSWQLHAASWIDFFSPPELRRIVCCADDTMLGAARLFTSAAVQLGLSTSAGTWWHRSDSFAEPYPSEEEKPSWTLCFHQSSWQDFVPPLKCCLPCNFCLFSGMDHCTTASIRLSFAVFRLSHLEYFYCCAQGSLG